MFEKVFKPFLGIPQALATAFPGFIAILLGILLVKWFPVLTPVYALALLLLVDFVWLEVGILPGIIVAIFLNGLGFLLWFKWFLFLALVGFIWIWANPPVAKLE